MQAAKQPVESGPPAASRFGWLGLVCVLTVLLVLSLRGITNPHIGYPDADRILMDGVFIRDFLGDLPLTHVYDYTIKYYAQYPALSIGYHPPFFPLVEAVFNAIFGINQWSSRLAVIFFAIIGVLGWYGLIARIFGNQTAFWTTLLLVTTPFLVQWMWFTMTDIPVLSMAMLTSYVFYRYAETGESRFLYTTAVLFSLTVWTKQTAVFLAIWFVLYLIVTGRLMARLKNKHVAGAILVVLVLLLPLAVITIWLGEMNIEQSVMPGQTRALLYRLSWQNLSVRITTLYQQHLTIPFLVLSVLGILWSIKKKDSRVVFFGLLILCTYAFFSYVMGKNDRYPIFWIPAFALFAALPEYYSRGKRTLRFACLTVLAGTAAFQTARAYAKPQPFATGYDEASAYVRQHSKSPVVFFDGYNNGYFTYFTRAGDPNRRMYVLRGDKLLTSSAVHSRKKLQIHARDRKDIETILDQYGVAYIVVEERDLSGLNIYEELRAYLREGPFLLEKEIPIEGTRKQLAGQSLLIYRYLNAKQPTRSSIELRLPIVGKTIQSTIGPGDGQQDR
jgi:hypothetical protein